MKRNNKLSEDKKENKLILIRDRVGVKPFYYYTKDNLILFSSELKSFHKYPNFENDDTKYEKFFGDDPIPAILTNRIVNEYSHLCGVIERGETLIEVPEIKKTAELIIKKLQEKDQEQFKALEKSIK